MSEMMLSCPESSMLSTGSRSNTREAAVASGDSASVARKFGARSVQDYEDLLCFWGSEGSSK